MNGSLLGLTRPIIICCTHRDLTEAQKFIHRLAEELKFTRGSKALDLACGKGRHAQTLAEQGLDVLGVDLSEQSITCAQTLQTDNLKFKVHDMRRFD